MLGLHCCRGFSLLQCQASRCSDFCCGSWALVAAHGLSCSTCGACGDQWSNPCLLHWHADPLPLNHQGSPRIWLVPCLFYSLSLTCSIWLALRRGPGFPGGTEVKNLPAKQEMQIWSLGGEDPLEQVMATPSIILAWGNPMGRGPWWVTVHGVAKSQTRLSMHALGSEIPPHLPYFDRSKLLGTAHIWGEWVIQGPESQAVGITGGHLRGFLPQRS